MAIFTGAGVAIVTPFNDDEERSINYDKLASLSRDVNERLYF